MATNSTGQSKQKMKNERNKFSNPYMEPKKKKVQSISKFVTFIIVERIAEAQANKKAKKMNSKRRRKLRERMLLQPANGGCTIVQGKREPRRNLSGSSQWFRLVGKGELLCGPRQTRTKRKALCCRTAG